MSYKYNAIFVTPFMVELLLFTYWQVSDVGFYTGRILDIIPVGILMLIALFYILIEVKQVILSPKKWFSDLWNFIEIIPQLLIIKNLV